MVRPNVKDWLTPEGLEKLEGWAINGLTNEQIAENMGIVQSTFYRWVAENKELKDVLKRTKDICDMQVENALFRKAIGYEYYEETTDFMFKDGVEVECGKKRVKKIMPPDTTAQIFWLKNRKPETWRDKQVIDASISNDDNFKLMQAYMGNIKNGKECETEETIKED